MTPAVGVDVGGSFIKAVLIGAEGEVVTRRREATPSTPSSILDAVAEMAAELGPGLALGVGLAGLVDHDRGTLVWAPHLPGKDVEFTDPLTRRLGVPVTVDNDANLAALAEQREGAAAGFDSVVMLTLGTGIGMGIVIDGTVFRGRAHAGEVGHVTVDPAGDRCACGRRGCWETKVSGSRFQADARAVLGAGHTAGDLVAATRGHAGAREALARAGEWLARGVEALVLALDPQVVVVGGAAAAAGDLLLGPVRTRISRTEGAAHRRETPVVGGILGADAGAIGAAISAAEESTR